LRISLLGEEKKGGLPIQQKFHFLEKIGAKLLCVEENLSKNSQI
jgi:hypothetical protein